MLWKALEIHHPSHLLVPGISRMLLSLFCFVRHKTQVHVTAHNYSASAKSTLQPASLSRPAAAGNAMHVWQIRAVRCRAAGEPEVRQYHFNNFGGLVLFSLPPKRFFARFLLRGTQRTRRYITRYVWVSRDVGGCLLYTSPSPRDRQKSRMPSSA